MQSVAFLEWIHLPTCAPQGASPWPLPWDNTTPSWNYSLAPGFGASPGAKSQESAFMAQSLFLLELGWMFGELKLGMSCKFLPHRPPREAKVRA